MNESVNVQTGQRPYLAPGWLAVLQRNALLIGGVGGLLCVLGFFIAPQQFYRAYLVGFLFWLGIALGCSALSMLQLMTGGAWGVVVRRIFEAAARTIPLLALLFVPIALGLRELYPWSRPETVAASEILQHKQAYLNVGFFIARAAFYFLVWWLFATIIGRLSLKQDQTGDPYIHRRMQLWSAAGVVFYTLTASFASFDWLMSLDPYWFSSVYGFHFVVGQGFAAFCFIILIAHRLSKTAPMEGVITARHFDDYGKLLFAFTMLWVYLTFSQFLIIWSANLPEEITWYLHRRAGGYWLWSVIVFLLHFVMPFFLLMSRTLRRNSRVLAWVVVPALLSHWLDLYWHAVPSVQPEGLSLHWLDLAAPVAIGGIWLAAFSWQVQRRSLLPLHDPHLEEAMGDA